MLVDEYDKPILDALDEPETAKANRDDLRGLYGTLKACDPHVELTFITGVSKFSKVSLFSDLNNLTDLTLDAAYAAICGYTEADLDTVFTSDLERVHASETLLSTFDVDFIAPEALSRKLLAGIPHDWHRRNDIARYEGYWSSVFYAWFQASMDGVSAEDATSRGRLDLAVRLGGNAYLCEANMSAVRLAGVVKRFGDVVAVPGWTWRWSRASSWWCWGRPGAARPR